MPLEALILDYGNVLSYAQQEHWYKAMAITPAPAASGVLWTSRMSSSQCGAPSGSSLMIMTCPGAADAPRTLETNGEYCLLRPSRRRPRPATG